MKNILFFFKALVFIGPSWIWGFASKIRFILYKNSILNSIGLPCNVISIGNLAVVGSGKTPLVEYILTQQEARGKKIGILSRGYGRTNKNIIVVQENSHPKDVGDEPLWLKMKHPNAQIIVGAKRGIASQKLQDVDLVLLDDGFQHHQLKRNKDIVLVDATQEMRDLWPMPLGRAREFSNALKRATDIVLTNTNLVTSEKRNLWKDFLIKKSSKSINFIEAETHFSGLKQLNGEIPTNFTLKGSKVYLVSGIARPENFKNCVVQEGALVVGHKILPDHDDRVLAQGDFIKKLGTEIINSHADCVLLTEKDAIKWVEAKTNFPCPIYVFCINMVLNRELL